MKKLLLTGLIGIIAIAFIGCTGDKNSNITKENQASNDIYISKDKEDYEEKADLETKPTDKVESENNIKSNIDKSDKTERIFKIVTKNIDYEVISGGEIKTVVLGIEDNIKKILSTISTKYFDGKPLELNSIETINNKKIAVINLGGDKSYWISRMQGSTGGLITQYTLIENILQREYKGYWIDGVKFTFNGKQFEATQHSPDLGKTIYQLPKTNSYSNISVKFDYPSNWTFAENPTEDISYVSFFDSNSEDDPVFWYSQGGAWLTDFERTEEDYKALLSESYPDIVIKGLTKTTIGGYDAIKLVFTYTSQDKKYIMTKYETIVGYASFEFSYTYSTEISNDYHSIFESIISSIEFI